MGEVASALGADETAVSEALTAATPTAQSIWTGIATTRASIHEHLPLKTASSTASRIGSSSPPSSDDCRTGNAAY